MLAVNLLFSMSIHWKRDVLTKKKKNNQALNKYFLIKIISQLKLEQLLK